MKKSLITGGTGTIGRCMAKSLKGYDVTIFSRGEQRQAEMKAKHPEFNYIIGDIRDSSGVYKAIKGQDYCFHLAALKHIDICEQNAREAIMTNVQGSLNVINACILNGCKLINMSSDKAVNPGSVYGRTKSLIEAVVLQAGFTNIRSGNILWSNGSVLNIWLDQIREKNEISITSMDMTRFFISPQTIVDFILSKMDDPGTHTVPMDAYKLIDLASAFIQKYGNDKTKIKVTGLRLGERLHEYRDENTCSSDNLKTNVWGLI
jgi:FlaA1/EpsC-like NDP-sugar epimerase